MVGLNATKLAVWLGRKLGVSHAHLEVAVDYLLKVIQDNSLPTFSKYYPRRHRIFLDVQSNLLPGKKNILRIPPSLVDPKYILGIYRCIFDTLRASREGYYMQNVDVFQRQIDADIISMSFFPNTWKWFQPNIIELQPAEAYYTRLTVDLKLMHDKNFFTIPVALEDEFKELALIDAKDAIYNMRKHYPNINTVFGSLDFDMDSFSDTEGKRTELIDKFKSDYWKDPERDRMYIG